MTSSQIIVGNNGPPVDVSVTEGVHPTAERQYLRQIFGNMQDNESGVHVDENVALTYSAVWRAINLIANTVAKTPLVVYEQKSDGSREPAREHPGYQVLKHPNRLMTAVTFKRLLQSHVLIWGNAYAWIRRDRDAQPVELIPLSPDRTGLAIHDGRLMYHTTIRNEVRHLFPSNVLHVHGLGYDGLTGYGVIEYAAQSMGLGLAARTLGSRYFRKGSIASGILHIPSGLTEEQERRLVDSFQKAHEGLGNAHKAIVLEDGARFIPLTIPNDQAQFLETRKYQDTIEIANWFGVPPHRIGGDVQSSYNSLEQENQAFLDDGVDPWFCNWECECDHKLLTEVQKRDESHHVEFDRDKLKRVDLKSRIEALTTELNNGGITLEEYRREMNRTSAGEDAKRFRMPVNIGFMDILGKEPEPVPDQLQHDEQDDDDRENELEEQATNVLADEVRRAIRWQGSKARKAFRKGQDFQEYVDELPGQIGEMAAKLAISTRLAVALVNPTASHVELAHAIALEVCSGMQASLNTCLDEPLPKAQIVATSVIECFESADRSRELAEVAIRRIKP